MVAKEKVLRITATDGRMILTSISYLTDAFDHDNPFDVSYSDNIVNPYDDLAASVHSKFCGEDDSDFTLDEAIFMQEALSEYRSYLQDSRPYAPKGSREYKQINEQLPKLIRASSKIKTLINHLSDVSSE